jgi:CDP-diacylglycerol---glycerol-3-phosphate 3-phosphatidyltransferase
MRYVTTPNLISLLRIPLAILFLNGSTFYRALAILLAMISDGLDGYYARRYAQCSKLGTLLDPFADKLFVITALSVLFLEQRITWLESAILVSRDFSVLLFGIYLILTQNLANYRFRAIWCGKVTTSLQFTVLLALTLHFPIPSYLYSVFIVLGVLALFELYFVDHAQKPIT